MAGAAACGIPPKRLQHQRKGRATVLPNAHVAVVIFGGLVSSTLLDTLLTPVMFWLLGRRATEPLLATSGKKTVTVRFTAK